MQAQELTKVKLELELYREEAERLQKMLEEELEVREILKYLLDVTDEDLDDPNLEWEVKSDG